MYEHYPLGVVKRLVEVGFSLENSIRYVVSELNLPDTDFLEILVQLSSEGAIDPITELTIFYEWKKALSRSKCKATVKQLANFLWYLQ